MSDKYILHKNLLFKLNLNSENVLETRFSKKAKLTFRRKVHPSKAAFEEIKAIKKQESEKPFSRTTT